MGNVGREILYNLTLKHRERTMLTLASKSDWLNCSFGNLIIKFIAQESVEKTKKIVTKFEICRPTVLLSPNKKTLFSSIQNCFSKVAINVFAIP